MLYAVLPWSEGVFVLVNVGVELVRVTVMVGVSVCVNAGKISVIEGNGIRVVVVVSVLKPIGVTVSESWGVGVMEGLGV
jgi:hypothetical protein